MAKQHSKKKQEKLELHKVYYDIKNPGAYGGVGRLKANTRKVNKRSVEHWLEKEESYTLHKPVKYDFPRRRVIVAGIDSQWQLDVLDTSRYQKYNDGVRYLLTVIDVFSKYAWVRPVKYKSADAVTEAFHSILAEGRVPQKVQSDKGKEFTNAKFQTLLKKSGIEFFTTENETIKASIVERFNRSIQSKLHRLFTHNHSYEYLKQLPHLVKDWCTIILPTEVLVWLLCQCQTKIVKKFG